VSEQARCETCAFAQSESAEQLFCRRFPPQMLALPVQHQLTRQVQIQAASAFPTVHKLAWCGEWKDGKKAVPLTVAS